MATPAEIIAARVNGTYVAEEPVSRESTSAGADSDLTSPTRSVNSDINAFPVLGGKPVVVSSTSWGPAQNGNGAAQVAPALNSTSASQSLTSARPAARMNTLTIQEAFSLDVEDQVHMPRPEFIKVLTQVKAETGTSIECTTSHHTKKRTFLISGKPAQVKTAKRLVIRKLTKPVTLTFDVPAKVRSKIIGPQGRTLKPIIADNNVKISIAQFEASPEPQDEDADNDDDDSDDIFAQTVAVTIEGDGDGAKNAKDEILAIVKEATKNALVSVTLSEFIKPFAGAAVSKLAQEFQLLDFVVPPYNSRSNSVIISGERAAVVDARDQLRSLLAVLEASLVVETVPIPTVKHQFLPIEDILEEESVLIKLPTRGETGVQFIGERKKIPVAQEKARKVTSQYKVEVLEMSKAHKGNLEHVKAIAALLANNKAFANIADEHGVAINPPSLAELEDPNTATIPIEVVVLETDSDKAKNARKAVVAVVNSISVEDTKVVDDIDEFFHNQIAEALAAVDNLQHVILNKKVVLYDGSARSADDFDDFATASDVLEHGNAALDQFRTLQADLITQTLAVPADEHKIVSATLKSILRSVDDNLVNVKIDKSANEVEARGLKKEVAKVLREIAAVLDENREYKDQGGYTTTVEVPASVLPRIIGKGGANLNALRAEYGVNIDIADRDDEQTKVEIVISGIKRSADDAKAAIAALAKKLADDTVARLKIEEQYHRRIIGPNFSSILRLQDKYNVRIWFPSEHNQNFADAPRSNNEVVIRGPSRSVAKAEEELLELYQFEKENGFKETIKVPTAAIGRVIGKNGETIKDIADGTGVDFKFAKDRASEEEHGYAEVELTGSRKALKDAAQKISDIVSEAENFVTVEVDVPRAYHGGLIGPSGSVRRTIIAAAGGENALASQYNRFMKFPSESSDSDVVVCAGDKRIVEKIVSQIEQFVAKKKAEVKEKIEVPREKHGVLIGHGGLTRQALLDEFDVQIFVPRASEKSPFVEVSGLPENIERVRAKIAELTKDNWSHSLEVPASLHSFVSDRGLLIKTLRVDHGVEVSHGNRSREASSLSNATIPTPPSEFVADEPALFVSEFDGNTGTKTIPWRFVGDEEAAAKAHALVSEQLERAKSASHAGWFYVPEPRSQFSKIIGPQGRKLAQLRKNTDAFVSVPRTGEKNGNYVYIVGSDASVQQAGDLLKKALQ